MKAAVPAGAHEWVSFEDPNEERTWLLDVTFLESGWECIYGRGCQGVLTGPAAEFEQGCCSYGAHFTGQEDSERVEAAARTLSDEQWQWKSTAARRGGPLRRSKTGEATTRLVEDACIFLNRPGFPGGAGCALHRAALEGGVPPRTLKPDVCWQLPFRRDDATAPDGHVTTTIEEWGRRHWGKGGAEFAWWCTEAPEAFTGAEPVFVSARDELTALVGEEVYEMIAHYLDWRFNRAARVAGEGGKPSSKPRSVRLPHPTVRT